MRTKALPRDAADALAWSGVVRVQSPPAAALPTCAPEGSSRFASRRNGQMAPCRWLAVRAILLVDAAPGFEEAVEAQLLRIPEIVALAQVKDHDYDWAVAVEYRDAVQFQQVVQSRFFSIAGLKGWEKVESPSPQLLAKLSPVKR
jgi:hypothetical protein